MDVPLRSSEPLPDAVAANWVDRFAPVAARPWLRLARLDRPTGVWLLMLPGWQGVTLAAAGAHRWPNVRLLTIFAVGAVLMRAAGCAVNDIVDRDLDALVSRTAARPVASGQISRTAAAVFALTCTAASAALLPWLNLTTFWLALAAVPLVLAYPLMKRITWWPQAWLGLTFNWGALMGYAAASPHAPWGPALLLYAAGVAWTLGYDTIYALQDLEDDALAGVKSSARRLRGAVRPFVAAAYLVSLALALGAGLLAHLGSLFAVGIAVQAAHFALQVWRLRADDPRTALAIFRSNTRSGLILVFALTFGSL